MTKKLDENLVLNELKGQSAFFKSGRTMAKEEEKVLSHDTVIPRNQDAMPPRHRDTVTPSNHDTVVSSNHREVEVIRKLVRDVGKEAATHRFTKEEKQSLMEVVFRYKQQGISTSENEITRIAINYILRDYKQDGDKSFLAQVIQELYS